MELRAIQYESDADDLTTDKLYFHLHSLEKEYNRIYNKIKNDSSIDHSKYLIAMCSIHDVIRSIQKSLTNSQK